MRPVHRWLQRPPATRQPAAPTYRAAFRNELGTHARGAVLQESIFAGAGGPRVQGLVVLARKRSGISAHAEMSAAPPAHTMRKTDRLRYPDQTIRVPFFPYDLGFGTT